MKWHKNKNNVDILGENTRHRVIAELKMSDSKADWVDGFGKLIYSRDMMEEEKDRRNAILMYIVADQEPSSVLIRLATKHRITLAVFDPHRNGFLLYNAVNVAAVKRVFKTAILLEKA